MIRAMPSASVTILGGVLVASVALNVWQWQRRPQPSAPARVQKSRSHGESAPSAGSAATAGRAAGSGSLSGSCPMQLAEMSTRLAKAEAEIEERLGPNERFERSALAPDREPPIREVLAKRFADAPKSFAWHLECRVGTCRLEAVQPEHGAQYDWQAKLQAAPLGGDVNPSMFMAGSPSQDPVSKEPLFSDLAYLSLPGAGSVSGMDLLQRIVERLRNDGGLRDCDTGAEGFVSLRLDLDPGTQRVEVAAGGSLAVLPAGVCVRRALDAAIATESIPPTATGAVLFHTVAFPLGG